MATFPTLLAQKLSQSTKQTKTQNVVIVPLGDGYQSRIGIGQKPFRDIWDLNWNEMTHANYLVFEQFFKEHGLFIPFNFTPPNGSESTFIFDTAPTVSDNGLKAPHTRYTVTAKVKEQDAYEL